MSTTKNAPLRGLVAHASAFALAVLVGAVATLGVRSLFLAPEAARPMGAATPARGHHAGPGHEGHAHAQSALGGDDRTGPERSPSTTDPHARHGHDDPARATTGPEEAEATTVERGAVPGHVGVLLDLGNSACPVMGGDTDGATYTEWNGLRIGHCCPGCTKRFLANPEALLDEVAPRWRDAAAAVARVKKAEGAARTEALASLRGDWSVVREPVDETVK